MASSLPSLSVVGFESCAFHAAAKKLVQRVQSSAPSIVGSVDVRTLPSAPEFHEWTQSQGRERGTTSPDCSSDGTIIGGYSELRLWLADYVQSALTTSERIVAILSLQKHAKSRWVSDFRFACALLGGKARVFLIDAEDGTKDCIWAAAPHGGGLGAAMLAGGPKPTWCAMLNMVSDAAHPEIQRRLIAAIRAVEAAGVPVFNGTEAHAYTAGKVAQHSLLHLAGLPSPRTIAVSKCAVDSLARMASDAGLCYPLLLKPNAGGFGNGIVKFASEQELRQTEASETLHGAFGHDGLAVLQEHVVPKDGRIGRIWVLDGKVLCAVLALPMGVGISGKTSASGCMADAKAAATALTWNPPEKVKAGALRLAEIVGAKWGSVEVLLPPDCAQEDWLYFDLNLSCFSSLPDPALVADPDNLWQDGFDPYVEVARFVLGVASSKKRKACEVAGGDREE